LAKTKKAAVKKKTAEAAQPAPLRSRRSGQRIRRLPRLKSRKLRRELRANQPKVGGSFRRLGRVFILIKQHPRLFLGITAAYALLTILLVRGLGGAVHIGELKPTLQELFQGVRFGKAVTTAALFTTLFSTAGTATLANGAAYQAILLIVISLVVIWSLREIYAGRQPTIKDSFYKSMSPLVQFVLVALIIGLQLTPMLLGNWLYSAVMSGGIAIAATEKLIWIILFGCLFALSLYLICASLFALFVVTLPDMTPLKALRNARLLVRYRRWTILRKILFLPIALFVLAAVIMLPFLLWLPAVAEWVFFVLTLFGWLVALIYLYGLYRELINE
jgi:hypothetical protein